MLQLSGWIGFGQPCGGCDKVTVTASPLLTGAGMDGLVCTIHTLLDLDLGWHAYPAAGRVRSNSGRHGRQATVDMAMSPCFGETGQVQQGRMHTVGSSIGFWCMCE